MRIVFAGTPDFAVPCLQALIESDCRIVAVLTRPDRPAGRGRVLHASPVKRRALEAGLRVEQPAPLLDALDCLTALQPELMVVVAYGVIVPEAILTIPALGVSTYMPHCCRGGAGRHPLRARSRRVIAPPALP